ncbi:phosphohydrolase [Romboutsia ilealis]|uniref:phosphohydrolase n=1 Tax=Romboutsia ilealis TaxID=1115758 RepID=UPI002574603A|nr:phosphohydrolase [Romboutsia ilealis]
MADYITTYSKIHLAPIEPEEKDILIEDIAHALSLMCRANGHFKEFYSVGQHCIYCCEEAIKRGYSNTVALACLLHDASEAYLADITRPVKKNLQNYLKIEEVLQNTIYEKYIGRELTKEEEELISLVDDAMLYNEFIDYMNEKLQTKDSQFVSKPAFEFIEFSKVENKYKELFNILVNKCREENTAKSCF